MIRNYFITAWRNLVRNKSFSVINLLGLALGITCSLLIMLWVQSEKNVDRFHVNGDQLFQVLERNYYDNKIEVQYSTQGLLADELKKVIPEIEYAASLDAKSTITFEAGNKINKMSGSFAGDDFFKMFSYPLLQGMNGTALNMPDGIAISRKMAEIFFGSPEAAIGKTIRWENKEDLQVTAVFENMAGNSSRQVDFLRSWVAYVKHNPWVNNWGNSDPATFVQLKKNADVRKVEAKIKDFIYRYKNRDIGSRVELGLQPYADKYLYSRFKDGEIDGGRIEYVRLFTIVAIFILLIACINFMNLSTARSAKRAKEVGVRKVIGAGRLSLIAQFTGEAMLLTFISFAISILMVNALLPAFNALTGKEITLPFSRPVFWLALFALLLLTGFISGSYPALFLSALNPVKVLKGRLKFTWSAIFFRKALVVFQFTLSIVLIVGMIVIYRQMDYIQNKNLGYDRENLLYIPIEGELVTKYNLFKEQANQLPGVSTVTKMRNSPTVIGHHTGNIEWKGKDPNLAVSFADAVVGYDFVKTMNLQLKEGRDFSESFGTDSASYILNEAAVKKIGYKEPLGQPVSWGNRPGKIIGVLKDFHFNSIHQEIEPLIIRLDENWGWGNILIRTKAGETKAAIEGLEKLCKSLNPRFPFTYKFSDEEYDNLYRSEQVVTKLSNWFAFLGIFISCLGLFGLVMFTAAQRTKEIGVRKVLGASVPNIASLLSIHFLKLVLLAILVAVPLATYFMNQWLSRFAYKVEIEWWMFALAGLATIVIALITISFQSIKSALANPVKSLRTE